MAKAFECDECGTLYKKELKDGIKPVKSTAIKYAWITCTSGKGSLDVCPSCLSKIAEQLITHFNKYK